MRNYQFEVLDNELNQHKEEAIQRDRKQQIKAKKQEKKYKLRKWVYVVLWTIFIGFIAIAIYQFFTIKTYYTTPAGNYQCIGKLIKVCGGSREVSDYLGA